MDFLCFGIDIVASVSNVPCLSDGMIYGYTLLLYSLSIYVSVDGILFRLFCTRFVYRKRVAASHTATA